MSLYLFVTYVLDSYTPDEPALRVRSLSRENPFAINSLRFTPLKQELLFTDFPFARSPGSEGGISVLDISALYTFP